MRVLLHILLFVLSQATAAGNNDAVNERIPVTFQQMEEHWGIDCTASWTTLESLACDQADTLSPTLRLCAAIYQRPGSPKNINCPDFQGAAVAAGDGLCGQLQALITAARACGFSPD